MTKLYLQNYNERPESHKTFPQRPVLFLEFLRTDGQEWSGRLEPIQPTSVADGSTETEDEEDDGAPDHVHVDHLLQLGPLVPRPPVVQHRLALVAGVDDHPLHVVRVLHDTFSQQQIIFPHRDPLSPGLDQAPVEPVDLGRGRVTFCTVRVQINTNQYEY